MKRLLTRIISVLSAVVMLSAMSSCRKAPINGALDGQWQLMTVDRADGTQIVPEHRVYYCFYLHTSNLMSPNVDKATANMTYVKDKELTLEFPYETSERLEWFYIDPDDCVSLPDISENPDATGVTIRFDIKKLDSSSLVMESVAGTVFTFRRY